jgi:WbqC-like protein family
MKLAVMQPYLFPYLGYFQLIAAADTFVVYDDVPFIRGGWINRNRLNVNGSPTYFSVPIEDASSFRSIRETNVQAAQYPRWRRKFFGTIEGSYRKASCYSVIRPMLEAVFPEDERGTIAEVARRSLTAVCDHCGIATRFVESSTAYENAHLHKAARLIDICKRERSDTYINAQGGQELYTKEEFSAHAISLQILRSVPVPYPQPPSEGFIANLSMIDVMMHNSREQLAQHLKSFEVV